MIQARIKVIINRLIHFLKRELKEMKKDKYLQFILIASGPISGATSR
jgi:hypothetical protein